MQDSFFLSAKISESVKNRMLEVVDAPTDNFNTLVEISGLNPKRSFRYADLRGVVFDDTDLRGFDFTGANLLGARGRNVVWDATTVLEDAEIEGSIFAETKADDELELYPTLAQRHWTDIIIWMDGLLAHEQDFAENGRILLRLFSTFSDSFVRRRALQVLARKQNFETILKIISENVFEPHDRKLVPVAFKVLDQLYSHHSEAVTAFVIGQLKGPLVSDAANFLAKYLKGSRLAMLVNYISRNESAPVRKQFIAALIEREGIVRVTVARDPFNGDVYDFGTAIASFNVVMTSRLIEGKIRAEMQATPFKGPFYETFVAEPVSKYEKILENLNALNRYGFRWNLPTLEQVRAASKRRVGIQASFF